MAYTGKQSKTGGRGGKTGGKVQPAYNMSFNPTPGQDGSELIRATGFFANEGKKHYSVKVNEDITIPAGSMLYLFPETRD